MAAGKMHGRGTKTWVDGTEYRGEFFRGKEHGRGTKSWPDGSEHSGQFRFGVRDGPGVHVSKRGVKSEGIFKDNAFGLEDDGVQAPMKADITHEEGNHNPPTLLDLALKRLAVVTDTLPQMNRASDLMAKIPLHLHPVMARTFAEVAEGLSHGFRTQLPLIAWRSTPEVRLANTRLLPADLTKLTYFLEANYHLKKLGIIACKLSGETIAPIAQFMGSSPYLEEADLSWNPISRWGSVGGR
ncbi:unnamed protein product [Discosporangium mesarthrocarpum]